MRANRIFDAPAFANASEHSFDSWVDKTRVAHAFNSWDIILPLCSCCKATERRKILKDQIKVKECENKRMEYID